MTFQVGDRVRLSEYGARCMGALIMIRPPRCGVVMPTLDGHFAATGRVLVEFAGWTGGHDGRCSRRERVDRWYFPPAQLEHASPQLELEL